VDGKGFQDIIEAYRSGRGIEQLGEPGRNTTIGVVATNTPFNKVEMRKIAEMAHDGMARAINPIHTMVDGDTIFAMSTGTPLSALTSAPLARLPPKPSPKPLSEP